MTYCALHRQRIVRGKPVVTPVEAAGGMCTPGCTRKPALRATGLVLCMMHHRRLERTGQIGPPGKLPQHGESNPSWGGGRYLNPDGYVRLRVDKRHMLEHRYVMEQHLGRPLWPDENVHHRNGVRHDNRLENLEIWVKAQPPGQRVADVLAWAQEMVERYGHR